MIAAPDSLRTEGDSRVRTSRLVQRRPIWHLGIWNWSVPRASEGLRHHSRERERNNHRVSPKRGISPRLDAGQE